MTTPKKGATLLGLPDRFVAVEIETEAPPAFDAAQYSFFGDLSAADSGLEGALEDGLEGPPPEEGLSRECGLHVAEEEALPLDDEEDLSVASIFRNQLGLGPARSPTKRVDPDDDAGLDALLKDPLSIARDQLRYDDYDHRELPAELYPDAAATGQTQSLFGATASPYGLFDGGYAGMLGSSQPAGVANDGRAASAPDQSRPQAPQPAADVATGSALLRMLKKPSQQPIKAMTLEELEARILGGTETPAAPAAGHLSGPGGIGADGAVVAAGHNQHLQQEQSGESLNRPLPGTIAGGGGSGGGARGLAAPGPRVPPAGMPGGPLQPPGSFPLQMQPPRLPSGPPLSPGMHGPPPGMHYHQHHPQMHGPQPPPGPMPIHMMPPGSPGPGMYPPPSMMGPGPQPPSLMYNGNGMMPPLHHLHNPPGPGMLPQGPMGPPLYGPGPAGMYPPRGPMPPYGSGPYMQDGYAVRPLGPPSGTPGPMHGMPARPGPFGYGPPALGPGSGTGLQQQPQQQPQQMAMPGQPRPAMLAVPPPPPMGTERAQRSGPVLGPGAAGARPAGQPRQGSGPQGGSEFGQQFSRASGGGPIALAAAAAGPGGRLGGKWMRPEDVGYVVRSMLYTVANGVPYVEDYYYQAFVHKHVAQPSRQQLSPGAFPMAAPFVPETLRELSEDQMSMMRLDPSARAKFVEGLQGLGKIVLSNIRTPKVLMDLTDRGGRPGGDARARTASAAEGSADISTGSDQHGRGAGAAARPLEQEPLLAARIMIEDCMDLLLDVDDIDRLANHMAALAQAQQRAVAVAAALPHPGAAPAAVAAASPPVGPYGPSAAAPPPPMQLRQRRELLLTGINDAFRLPNSPRGATAGDGGGLISEGSMDLDAGAGSARPAGPLGDGVLIRILALSKGRGVVARALLAITPPASLAAAAVGNGNGGAQGGSDTPAAAASAAQPNGAAAAPAATAAGSGNDGLLGTDTPSPFVLLWGTLRNAWSVFGTSMQQDAATERPFLEATSGLAVAMREALLRLQTRRDVVDAAAAFNAGCQQHVDALSGAQGGSGAAAAMAMETTLLPLAQTRVAAEAAADASVAAAPAAWLGEALAALVTRASQLGLATATSAGGEDAAAGGSGGGGATVGDSVAGEWRREYDALQGRLARHLETLGEIHSMAAASSNAEALAVVRSLSCRLLVTAMLQHASPEQAQQLKAALAVLSA